MAGSAGGKVVWPRSGWHHVHAALQAFWHSSAHVLGQALELEFGVDLTIGPALEEGFYYDCYMGDKVWGGCEAAAAADLHGQCCCGLHACRTCQTRTKHALKSGWTRPARRTSALSECVAGAAGGLSACAVLQLMLCCS